MNDVSTTFRSALPAVDYASLRVVTERQEMIQVRQDVLQPVERSVDRGGMVTVINNGGMGYAATPDLSEAGIRKGAQRAAGWANTTAGRTVTSFDDLDLNVPKGEYRSPVKKQWENVPTGEKIDLLMEESRRLKTGDRIVDWSCFLWNREIGIRFVSSNGGDFTQVFSLFVPMLQVTASDGSDVIQRGTGARGGRQGGFEILDEIGFRDQAPVIADEALELLSAPNCPSGNMDLLLDADQLILQIHESIGHPLELDRILGDERNYAGRSFVEPGMFGSYRYGSDLLNITFDPTMPGELASYAFDDDGQPGKKEYLIEKGILKRGLGSITSQTRSGLPGVANSRSSGWNRQPIDRMGNLNLEPGESSLDEMIAAVDRGVFMKTNISWSIDDSRNKFQFGCEWGRLIENGKLTTVVKKPNYRGISATFWRNLKMAGNRDTFEILGTPNCGKGEPNQVIWTGHASPACLFADVDVFGGE